MAPTIAVSRMLERAGLKLQDFDFYEIHEAFAAQVLATLKALEDPDYCKHVLGRDAAAGRHRPRQAERQGLEPRLRPPVRGDRRAHRRQPRQAAGRARRARPDLGLHRRRHGRRRHPGERQGRRDAHGGLRRTPRSGLWRPHPVFAFESGMVQMKARVCVNTVLDAQLSAYPRLAFAFVGWHRPGIGRSKSRAEHATGHCIPNKQVAQFQDIDPVSVFCRMSISLGSPLGTKLTGGRAYIDVYALRSCFTQLFWEWHEQTPDFER